jgi:hypothetical protein
MLIINIIFKKKIFWVVLFKVYFMDERISQKVPITANEQDIIYPKNSCFTWQESQIMHLHNLFTACL